MAILTSPSVCSLHYLASGWTPRSLLHFVATRQSRSPDAFCALIDCGALLCGLDNEEVAKLLMEGPLTKDACVFLARGTDLPMILLKGATHAVPLEDANIRPERRFCYFDQPHTTGIDIQQPPLGVLLKDNKALPLPSEASDASTASALRDLQAALLLKSLEQEELQCRSLDLSSAWKDAALRNLLSTGSTGSVGDAAVLLEDVPVGIGNDVGDAARGSVPGLDVAAVERAQQRAMQLLGGPLAKTKEIKK
eukprot:Skav202842  [mRNA]  locus=scaffold746:143669:146156:+ [translate_table: standard]